MKYLITGGTGLLGSELIPQLIAEGHDVVNLSRGGRPSGMKGWENVKWNGKVVPDAVKGIDIVINLAGANVGKRWTEDYKKEIMDSRVHATRACVNFIKSQSQPPQVFISASGVNYYGSDFEEPKVETDRAGEGFLSKVCKAWEHEAKLSPIRTVMLRISPVLSLDGGPLEKLVTPFKMFVGGPTGSGDQGFPWIHIDDMVAVIRFFIAETATNGPYNIVAPQLISNKKFAKALGKALNRPSFFPLPKFMLKTIFGEMSVVLWGGVVAKADKLLEAGFEFKYKTIDEALANLLKG